MVTETLELRSRVINDVTFDYPTREDNTSEHDNTNIENSILHK